MSKATLFPPGQERRPDGGPAGQAPCGGDGGVGATPGRARASPSGWVEGTRGWAGKPDGLSSSPVSSTYERCDSVYPSCKMR